MGGDIATAIQAAAPEAEVVLAPVHGPLPPDAPGPGAGRHPPRRQPRRAVPTATSSGSTSSVPGSTASRPRSSRAGSSPAPRRRRGPHLRVGARHDARPREAAPRRMGRRTAGPLELDRARRPPRPDPRSRRARRHRIGDRHPRSCVRDGHRCHPPHRRTEPGARRHDRPVARRTCSRSPTTSCSPRRPHRGRPASSGEAELALVKPGVHLVNIARGALVDQDALRSRARRRPGGGGQPRRLRTGAAPGRALALRAPEGPAQPAHLVEQPGARRPDRRAVGRQRAPVRRGPPARGDRRPGRALLTKPESAKERA